MKEDFLHYLWKHKKFDHQNIKTTSGAPIKLHAPGNHNQLSGPDFFNARLSIGKQLWAGNVELHLKASSWYAHGHERDTAYDNVILHVVWEDDIDVYGKNEEPLPTLLLKDYVNNELIAHYKRLFNHRDKTFINCERDFDSVPLALVQDWLERIYLERLERKVSEVELMLHDSKNDWEAVLFKMLARNFGTKINGQAFSQLATALPFKIIRKVRQVEGQLEALLLGHVELLPQAGDGQVAHWRREYDFIKHKYDLSPYIGPPVQFFRLRPPNFPTLRLAQLARLYERQDQLFQKIIETGDVEGLRSLFQLQASSYWDTHYNFTKRHKKHSKKLSANFIDLLLINTIIPVKFAYLKAKPTGDISKLLALIANIPAEKNQKVKPYYDLRELPKNALNSQALLQLKTAYCEPNQCLKCRIGNYLIADTST